MRKIKFRAFKLGTKEFVYGLLSTYKFGYFNIEGFKVEEETIGQFTGLLDIEGNEIYEGDILKDSDGNKLFVIFEDGCFNIKIRIKDKYFYTDTFLKKAVINSFKLKVIGNLYENEWLSKLVSTN